MVVDVSFISVRLVLPRLAELLTASGDLLLLVKPQFEVGRSRLGKNGLVRSEADRHAVLTAVTESATQLGLVIAGVAPSPVPGSTGNAEYLLWCRRTGPGLDATGIVDAVSRTVSEPVG